MTASHKEVNELSSETSVAEATLVFSYLSVVPVWQIVTCFFPPPYFISPVFQTEK